MPRQLVKLQSPGCSCCTEILVELSVNKSRRMQHVFDCCTSFFFRVRTRGSAISQMSLLNRDWITTQSFWSRKTFAEMTSVALLQTSDVKFYDRMDLSTPASVLEQAAALTGTLATWAPPRLVPNFEPPRQPAIRSVLWFSLASCLLLTSYTSLPAFVVGARRGWPLLQ